MTKTHRYLGSEPFDVTAWQYQPQAPRPIWVCRALHDLDNQGELSAVAANGELVTCHETDWAVHYGDGVVVLTDPEFTKLFSRLC